jgi:hypothetical protein
MSSLKGEVAELIRKCEAVRWPVTYVGKHPVVHIPNVQKPVTLPTTPRGERSVENPASILRRHGLNEAYQQYLDEKKNGAKMATERVRASNQRKLDAAEAAAKAANSSTGSVLLKNGSRAPVSVTVTRDMAENWLKVTDEAEDFFQRPLRQTVVHYYAQQMRDGEWQENMPDGIICIDPKGRLINGQKRMHALLESGLESLEFLVSYDVPTDLFAYFDGAQPRSAADTFSVSGLPSGPEMQSAIRLAMLYEAMLRGDADRVNWVSWNKLRISNPDALAFYRRRPELGALKEMGKAIQMRTGLTAASVIVFEFYADKAWPSRVRRGQKDPLQQFLLGVRDGEHMAMTDPAMKLREWARDHKGERLPAKREINLYLLFRAWQEFCTPNGRKSTAIHYKRSWPMLVPFHPDGEETALTNLARP